MPRNSDLEQFFQAVFELIAALLRGLLWMFGLTSAQRAQARAGSNAREAERKAEAQRQEWMDIVRQQHARGRAGPASQDKARAALRGRGGRPNPLDDRWF